MSGAGAVVFDPGIALTMRVASWRAVFEAFGAPEGYAASAGDSSRTIARALFGAACPTALRGALFALAQLASMAARRAIEEAAGDTGYEGAADARGPRDESPGELAARLLVLRATVPAAAREIDRVLERARLRLSRSAPARPTYELYARAARRADHVEACMTALKGTSSAEVWLYEDDGGSLHIAALDASAVDVLRFDVPDGRLRVTCVDPTRVTRYAETLGRALYDDATFFSDRPSFTLRPLLALGADGIASAIAKGGARTGVNGAAKRPAAAVRARVIACELDTGEDAHIAVTGPDALASLERHVKATGGYLTRATVRFDLAGVATPVDAHLALPSRVTFSAPEHEASARAALEALGVFEPGKLGDDLWSLAPWVHPEWRWRELAGDADLDALVKEGVLVKVAATRRVAGARTLGRSLLTFALASEPGMHYAMAEDPSVAARTVAADDTAVLALDLAKLAARIGRALRLDRADATAGAREALEALGAYAAGVLRTKRAELVFVLLARAPGTEREAKRVTKELRAWGAPAHVVALVPEGSGAGAGVIEVEMRGVRACDGAVEKAAKEAGVLAELDAWRLAPESARLVIDGATSRAWLDGVPLAKLSSRAYLMLEGLATLGPEVDAKALGEYISPHAEVDSTARQTRALVTSGIAKSFAAARAKAPEGSDRIVETAGRGGYRLGVTAWATGVKARGEKPKAQRAR